MNKQTLILLFTFIVGVLASGARAANYIWDGGYTSGNNWNSANNWNPDSAPTAPGTGTHTIQFAGSTRTSPNVSVSYNIYSITFNSGAAAFNVTWSGGTLTIQGGGVVNNDDTLQTITAPITMGAAQTWNAASGGLTFGGAITKASKLLTITGGNSTTINGILTGSGGLTKEGGGDLILNPSASACAIGTITVNSGRLFIFNANAIANSAILDVSSGATLDFGITGGATSANTMTFDSGSCLANRVGTLTLTGTTTFPSVGTMIFNQDDAATTAITINRAPFVALTGDLTIQVGSNNVTVGSVTLAGAINGAGGLSKTSCGTLILGGANSYSGDTTISGGTLALASGGSLNVASSVNIAAGTTFDVSAKATPYTWGASASLVASGNGATVGTTAATIKGPSSGTVSMGSRPIVLTFTPAAFTGDTTHPSLYISQGTLSLNGNAFTVNNAAATPLGIGTYRLIQQASGNITSAGSYSVAVTGTGLAAGTTASIQVSLGNVNLVVTKPTPAFFNLTASQAITYGTTSVTLGGTLSAGAVYPAAGETVSITINGSSQNATIAGGAGGFSVSFPAESIPYSASAYTITYAYAGSVNLNPAPNDTSTALTVNKRSLTVTATGVNKGYDGNVTATVTLADNRVSGDVLTLSNTSATFNNKNVGTTKTVSVSGIAVTGTDAGNYTFNTTASTTANITAKALTVTATGVNKGYDGNVTATVTLADNRVSGDVLTLSNTSATFNNKNVGTTKTVSVSGIAVTGTDAGNYTFNTTASTTANITAKALTVTATGVNKGYDGNATASVTLADNRVSGDVLTLSNTSATFNNKNVGTTKTVSVSGIAVSGTDAGNYTFNTTASTTANITTKALTVTATGVNKGYDGNATASVTLADNRVSGDVLTLSNTSATFNNKNVGTTKTISVSGIAVTGTDAGNYTFNTTASTTANITDKALTVTATGVNKGYDGNVTATVTLADNRVSGDVLTLSNTSATFNNKNAGTAKPVSVSGIAVTGTDAGNYTFNTTASTTANVIAKALTVTADNKARTYDEPNPVFTFSYSGFVSGEDIGNSDVTGSPLLATTAIPGSQVGGYTITAAIGTLNSGNYSFAVFVNGTLTIIAGVPTQVRIEDKADGSGLVVGDQYVRVNGSSTVYAITRDAGGNFVANVAATWSLTNLGGRVVSGDLVPQADGKSAIFTAHGAGAARIKTETSGLSGQSGMLTVPIEPGVISLPDFEGNIIASANPGYPNETYFVNGTGNNQYAEWSITTNGIESGSAAVALPGPNAMGGSSAYLQAMRVYYMPLLPNTEYTLGFWYKAVGAGFSGDNVGVGSVDPHESEMQLQLFEFSGADGSGSLTVKGLGNIGAQTNDWTYATYTFTTDPTTHSIGLKFGMLFGDGNRVSPTDSFYIDTTKALTVTNITAGNKIYDSTTTVTLNSGNAGLVGVQGGHNVTLQTSGATGAFSSKTAASGKPVPVSGLTLSGPDAGLYTLVQPVPTADITPKAITVTGVTASNKEYDGALTATLISGGAMLVGVQSGDVVNLVTSSGVGMFADKNVASGKSVTVSGLTLGGADAANYSLTQPPATADITRRALAVTASGANKSYDGTTNSVVTLSDNRIAGDVLTANFSTAGFANKNAGTAKSVSVSGIAISGTDAGNYSANTSTSATANITALAITVRATSDSKTYDGTTSSGAIPAITVGSLQSTDTKGFAQSFANKNVGASKTLVPAGVVNDGNGGNNYSVTFVNDTTGIITARTLAVTATGVNKSYDGTADATVTLADNRVAGDVLSASYTAASFADKNVGTAKPVSVNGIAISGTDAGNYSANTTASTTANIAGRTLTVSATGVNKSYDGTADATVNLADNRVAGDVLSASYVAASFADKNVGTAKSVSVSGIAISGTDVGNYSANATASTTANIAGRTLTVTATGVNKSYDGTADATVTLADNRVAGDVLSASYSAASFADKNVGTGKPVSVSGIAISGTDAGNYTANTTAGTTANIAGRTLAVSATGVNKSYDGTADATVTLADNRVAGDVLSASYTAASFVDKNVGTAKPVSVSGIAISGTDAGNYSANTTASTTANIAGRTLTVTATGVNKGYDGTADATVTLADNRVAGDVLSASYTAASFADKNVGTARPVSVSGIAISGTDAGNYSANTTASTTANIAGRTLTVSATGVNKGYDGTADATVTLADNRVAGDILSAGYTAASFADKNMGTAKPVSVSGISISGADAGNYSANTTAGTTANIAVRTLTVTATGVNKGYDGTADATVTLADNRVAGDVLSASYAVANFADKNVGTSKPVSVSGIAISGTDAGNYTANTTDTATANILALAITVKAAPDSKIYDGTISSTATPAITVGSLQGTDTIGLAQSFADKNSGTAKTLTPAGTVSDGNGGNNYSVTFVDDNTGIIFARALTVTADNKTRPYGEANPPLTATYTGFASGENMDNSGMTGSPSLMTTAAGTSPLGHYPITVALGTLTAANYSFSAFVDGTFTVTVFESTGDPGISKIESHGSNVTLTVHTDSNDWCSVIAADGSPVASWRVLDTVTSAPPNYVFMDSDSISSLSSRFYRVVIASAGVITTNLNTYAVYVKPMVTGSWSRLSMPIEVDPSNRLDSVLGEQLAHGLYGDDNNGDRLYAMNAEGGWHTLRLNSSHQWTSNGVPVALELNPCQGYWIKRMSGGVNAMAIYTGMMRTNTQTMAFRGKDWHLVAWPFATPRTQAQGLVKGWGFAASGARKGPSWAAADQLIIGEGSAAVSLFLNTDGNWYRTGATTPAWDVTMRAGEACYYYHIGDGFTWTVSQE